MNGTSGSRSSHDASRHRLTYCRPASTHFRAWPGPLQSQSAGS